MPPLGPWIHATPSDERILAFNSSDGNHAVLYKFTSDGDGELGAHELQVLGTIDQNLAEGDFLF